MARRKTNTLTEVELEFMQVVWAEGEVTTEDVMAALGDKGRNLADGTVRKMLSILVDKAYLTRRRDGQGFVYKPAVGEAQAKKSMVTDLLKRAFAGKAPLMVAALMKSGDVHKGDVDEIRRLINQAEKGVRK